MKIYSEITGNEYSTVDECLKAEEAFVIEQKAKETEQKAKEAEKARRLAEIDDAYAEYSNARKKYWRLNEAFIKDYADNKNDKCIKDFSALLNALLG